MTRAKRRPQSGSADRHATDLSARLGNALRDARHRAGLTQAEAARRAGLSQTTWSSLETRRDPRFTLVTWDRAAFAVGTSLNAYLPEATAADRPRDATQLKAQELVIVTARAGGWYGVPEAQLDQGARTSRFGDVVLERPRMRPAEIALIEIIDWFSDVGGQMRDWPRRLEALERQAIARMVGDDSVPKISGCWLVRATRRNRQLVGEHSNLFANRFPGSSRAWSAALGQPTAPMPTGSALLWISVDGQRIYPVRYGP